MKIRLKNKKLKTGKLSLFIEYYNGFYKTEEGKTIHDRKFEYLKLYPLQNPKTAQEKKESKEAFEIAEQILSIRKADFLQGKYNIKNDHKTKVRFLDYYRQAMEERYESKSNYDNWDAALKHLKLYCTPALTFENVNSDFVKGFRRFLDVEAKTKSDTLLSQNSKYTYFNKFKACIRKAYDENYLNENILKGIKSFAQGETQREYLMHDELQSLFRTDCKYPVLKNAFIFSCLTGLRWSDVNKLIWEEVRDEEGMSRIVFRQKKTDGMEYLYISEQARKLLKERGGGSDRVFYGLKYGAVYNTEILRWCMRAGITKHITFHSARHTNAVLLLENGADLYTVQKRLGHKEIRTTAIYAKIIDSKMKEAAEIIPTLNL
ncbi:MAG: site-specific integrase [Flavobacteriales bacterium]